MGRNGNARNLARYAAPLVAAAAAAMPGAAFAAWEWQFQQPVTAMAERIIDLHSFMLWICAAIFVGVFGVMFYSLFKHRKSVGHQAVQFHENTLVEVVWTVIPFLILLFMAYPATRTLLAMHDTSSPDMTIKVTGYQWKWGYDYIDGEGKGLGFISTLDTEQRDLSETSRPAGNDYLLKVDNPLVVPMGKRVRVITTGDDVIHSWSVPAFGVK